MNERRGAGNGLGDGAVQRPQSVLVQAGPREIQGEVETVLASAPEGVAAEISCPIVERIQRQRLTQQRRGALVPAETPEHNRLEIAGAKIVRASAQAHVEVLQRVRPIASPAVDLGQGVKAGSAPSRVPGRFVENRVGFVVAPKEPQCQAEIIKRLAVIRIGIASEQTLQRSAKMRLRLSEFAASEAP